MYVCSSHLLSSSSPLLSSPPHPLSTVADACADADAAGRLRAEPRSALAMQRRASRAAAHVSLFLCFVVVFLFFWLTRAINTCDNGISANVSFYAGTEATPCPVMQWVHGGAWILGSNGEYDGDNLASKHSVVFVAANYRLDSLGWLALEELQNETEDASFGNYGLLDQQMALKWTQDNIRKFGGDPNKVTVFGESAGGFAVCQHLTAPGSNGLFSRAIVQSGDCDGPWLVLAGKNAKRFGDELTTELGCPKVASAAARVACLRGKTVSQILDPYIRWLCPIPEPNNVWCNKTRRVSHAVDDGSNLVHAAPQAAAAAAAPFLSAFNRKNRDRSHRFFANTSSSNGLSGKKKKKRKTEKPWPTPRPPLAPIGGFVAVVDGVVLPDTPLRMIKQGKINTSPSGEKLQVIIGTNRDEMALFMIALGIILDGKQVELPVTNFDLELMAEHMVAYHDNWENATTVAAVLKAYPVAEFATPTVRAIKATTDAIFRCGSRRSARALSEQGIVTYLYSFEFESDSYKDPASPGCTATAGLGCGVYHSAEIKYAFDNYAGDDPNGYTMASIMSEMWTHFAKHGTPNVPGSQWATWPEYQKETDLSIKLLQLPRLESGLAKAGCDFWDQLPDQDAYLPNWNTPLSMTIPTR